MASAGVFGRGIWWWAIGYSAMLALVVWSVLAARQWALAELSTPQSTAEWEAWREDVRAQQEQPVPVRRRVPNSAEPPALVLTRDYFGIVMSAGILFCSLLYWVMAWLISGTLRAPSPATSDHRAS